MFQIRLGNNIDIMKELDSDKIDLVVTSPPYDDLRNYDNTCNWNFEIFKEVANELYRILKPGGVIVWIVSDATINGSETGTSFKQALYFKEIGLNIHDTMIWKKSTFTDTGSLKTRYGNIFEYMFIFSKGKPKTFNPIKDRLNKSVGRKRSGTVVQRDGTKKPILNKQFEIEQYGQRFNIWDIDACMSSIDRTIHPAQFPEKLVNDHIITWSNKGDLVLDPFMGSGTTGVVSLDLDRNFIGIEIVKKYYNIAEKRLIKMQKQCEMKLF